MTTFWLEEVVRCERNDVSVKEGGRFLTQTLVLFGSAFGLAAIISRDVSEYVFLSLLYYYLLFVEIEVRMFHWRQDWHAGFYEVQTAFDS
jgi:hypothetical protein